MIRVKCKRPKVKGKASLGRSCVFDPSFRHKFTYSHCNKYEGLITIDDDVVSSDTFNIVMTNKSNRHIKIDNNQTMNMPRSHEEKQICTIYKIVTFKQKPKPGKDENLMTNLKPNLKRKTYTKSPQEIQKQVKLK